VAPEDNDLIEEFIGGIRKFIPFAFPLDKAPEVMNFLDWLKGGIHLTQVPTTSCGRQFCGLGRA